MNTINKNSVISLLSDVIEGWETERDVVESRHEKVSIGHHIRDIQGVMEAITTGAVDEGIEGVIEEPKLEVLGTSTLYNYVQSLKEKIDALQRASVKRDKVLQESFRDLQEKNIEINEVYARLEEKL